MEAVRAAGPDDASRFIELAREGIDGLRSQRGGSLLLAQLGSAVERLDSTAFFDELLADPDRLVLMGTLEHVVTGVVVGHVELLDGGERLGRLDGYYVEPEARGIGLGHLLVDSAIGWFRDRRCMGVDGIALPGDRESKNFFETSGFKARQLTMHRPMG